MPAMFVTAAHCYAEFAVSSPATAKPIASTHCNYPRRDGQAEWAWVAWINSGMVDPLKVCYLSPHIQN